MKGISMSETSPGFVCAWPCCCCWANDFQHPSRMEPLLLWVILPWPSSPDWNSVLCIICKYHPCTYIANALYVSMPNAWNTLDPSIKQEKGLVPDCRLGFFPRYAKQATEQGNNQFSIKFVSKLPQVWRQHQFGSLHGDAEKCPAITAELWCS